MNRYKIVKHLASGGMADVFLARLETEGFSKPVVLKKILPSYAHSALWINSFFNEAKIMALLNHSHIVQVMDFGKLHSDYFLAMEYVEGGSLSDLKPKLSEEVVIWMGLEILKGLSYAHKKGVLHRDLSPSNILISKEGEVKITDFGVAKLKSQENTVFLKGKPSYMSPEQRRKEPLTEASDVWSLSLILKELLGSSTHYLEIGLRENPNERFQTCEEFEIALHQRCKVLKSDMTQRKCSEVLKNYPAWQKEILESETQVFKKKVFDLRWAIGVVFLILGIQVPAFYSNGYLSLNAKPWADIYIGGEYIGTTPLIRKPLATGSYTVEISNSVLQKRKKIEVQIKENQVFTRTILF